MARSDYGWRWAGSGFLGSPAGRNPEYAPDFDSEEPFEFEVPNEPTPPAPVGVFEED